MKLLLPEKATQQQFRHFLLHEAEVGLELAHPNIIRIVTVDQDPKNPYFVMEFFPAGSLSCACMRKETDFHPREGPGHPQAGGHGPGVHERQGLGPSRRQAGQHPGQQRRRG